MNVYIPYIPNYSAIKGPCPDGFHIPTKDERENLVYAGISIDARYDVDTGGTDFETKMKIPLAGLRASNSSNVSTQGTAGRYWSSEIYGENAYSIRFTSTIINPQYDRPRAYGHSIRPFKNIPIFPLNGEILKDGWTWIDGNEFEGNVIARNQGEGLISISYNDGRSCITIADKNLGATTVYNHGDTLSEANCGKYYQRGNNYGFPRTGSVTNSSTLVNASSYGPGNYYNSSTFITTSTQPIDWSSPQNDNLWGYEDLNKPSKLYKAYIGENPTWKPGANTVAYRPLTSTTTVNDQSGNNYNLTNYNGSFSDLNGVSCFNCGTSGYLTRPTTSSKIPSAGDSRTISIWAYATGTSSSYPRYVFSYGRQAATNLAINFYINTAKKYCWGSYTNEIKDTTDVTTSKWYLLTFTSSGTTCSFYINGELIGSGVYALNTSAVSSSYPLRLGRYNTTSSNYNYRGYLSECIIEDKAWTATEIANYFNDNKEKYGLS